MNKLLLILSVCIATNSIAQKKVNTKETWQPYAILSDKDKLTYYSGVVIVDSNLKKDELFLRAKRWFVDQYKSAKDVIQLEDKESGEITGKGIFLAKTPFITCEISHTVKIYIKDGRYKYEITNLTGTQHTEAGGFGIFYHAAQTLPFEVSNYHQPPKMWQKDYGIILTQVDANIKNTIDALKIYMLKQKEDF